MYSDSTCAMAFTEDISSVHWSTCENCKEKSLQAAENKTKCKHRQHCWKYCGANNMDPGDVPSELKDLTFIEELLIARVHPLISVFKLKGLQYGYRGNVINFPQNVQKFATQLPHPKENLLAIVNVRSEDKTGKIHDFRVRVKKVRDALQWLKNNNCYYKDIEISEDN
jgi:hypothetical protein